MPSIARFIKDLMSEDKFGSGFNDNIDDRIKHLNAPQLQGMYNHLTAASKSAKSPMWKSANDALIARIESLLKIRSEEAAKEKKALEEYRLKQQQKKQAVKDTRREKKRVMKMIEDNAHRTAELEVRELEQKRQANEKIEIMQKSFVGEERRNDWWKRTAVVFVLATAIIIVLFVTVKFSVFIFIGLLALDIICCVVVVYRAHLFTVVVPVKMNEDELEEEIKKRQDLLKKKAISVLLEKERKFQEMQEKDHQERKKRRAARKQREKFELELMERQRLEQIAMAKEVINRRESVKSAASSYADAIPAEGEAAPMVHHDVALFSRVESDVEQGPETSYISGSEEEAAGDAVTRDGGSGWVMKDMEADEKV